jgi:hypothetical protein
MMAAVGAPTGVRGSATPSTMLFFPLGKGDIPRVLPLLASHLHTAAVSLAIFLWCSWAGTSEN